MFYKIRSNLNRFKIAQLEKKQPLTCRELHRKAIGILHEAMENESNPIEYKRLMRNALFYEKRAANMLLNEKDSEPTRAVLFRSTGWMALKSGNFNEARELAQEGLNGNPHKETKEELEKLLKESNK